MKESLKIKSTVVWGHKVTNLKATHNRNIIPPLLARVVWGHKVTNLKATHNYFLAISLALFCCLRSQSYEFESNSQHDPTATTLTTSCLRSQSYEFESNSQLPYVRKTRRKVVWGHKVTNLKATHNCQKQLYFEKLLFEVTKLRIWKQLTTGRLRKGWKFVLFEVTKLRIWKQLTTLAKVGNLKSCCLRSQSYEFESNSQPAALPSKR